MLGAFSFFLDGMAGPDAPAYAATWPPSSAGGAAAFLEGGRRSGGGPAPRERSPIELLLSPAMPLLAALTPCRGDGSNGQGCRTSWPL